MSTWAKKKLLLCKWWLGEVTSIIKIVRFLWIQNHQYNRRKRCRFFFSLLLIFKIIKLLDKNRIHIYIFVLCLVVIVPDNLMVFVSNSITIWVFPKRWKHFKDVKKEKSFRTHERVEKKVKKEGKTGYWNQMKFMGVNNGLLNVESISSSHIVITFNDKIGKTL